MKVTGRAYWEKAMHCEVTWAMIVHAVMVGVEMKDPRNGMKLRSSKRRIDEARVFLEAVVERANKGRSKKEEVRSKEVVK